ncbi:MAG: hypothetical protein AAFY26_24260, partial [Cyanobacteria bacterium J06638_22]
WRWSCPIFLRQTFVEWVAHARPRSVWSQAFYQQQRHKGKSHQKAIRALAYKGTSINSKIASQYEIMVTD